MSVCKKYLEINSSDVRGNVLSQLQRDGGFYEKTENTEVKIAPSGNPPQGRHLHAQMWSVSMLSRFTVGGGSLFKSVQSVHVQVTFIMLQRGFMTRRICC